MGKGTKEEIAAGEEGVEEDGEKETSAIGVFGFGVGFVGF